MTAPTPSDQPITKTQRRALLAAWLGWAFDGLDGYLYILVAVPFVAKLMQTTAGDPAVARNAALIQAVFLVGWAVGGAVFGRIGDRLGRSRTLTLTILTYACFTGLTFFATEWWHLLIFRFIAALGIGGEWAAGSSLVSESLPARHRAWASATLQSGYMIGMIAAALSTNWISGLTGGDYRWVFVIGVIPAFATLWIRAAVPESDEWHAAKATQRTPPISALFSHELRRTTILLILLTGIALTTVWAFIYFSTQAIRAMPEVQGWKGTEVTALVTRVTIFFLIINIVGNFVATYLAKAVGYRAAFAILFAGSLACFLVGFRHPLSLDNVYWVTGACAITALGLFGLFPLYIPPLFPTLVRTLGAGVTYNAGRLISAAGTLGAGWLAAQAGGPTDALWYIGLLYVPGIVIALMSPVPVSVTGRSRR